MTTHAPNAAAATRVEERPQSAVRVRLAQGLPLGVLGVALLTFLLRLPYLGAPLSPDEGGFLMVAHQWQPGPSLYGHYWVDRPPLLIELFRIADGLGGLTALRLLGGVAAALTVLAVGMTARRVAGAAAGTWSAAVACALLVSPLAGATNTNGELLAAPFVAAGVWLTVIAVDQGRSRVGWAAVAAGACAVAALMVKQNMADVVVFAGVLGLVSWGMRVLRFGDLWRLVVRFTAGGTLAVAAVLGMAQLHGTSPGEVLFAMYAFRLRATSIVNASLSERLVRLQGLGQAELLTAAPLLVVALLLVLVLVRLGVVGSRPAADPLRSAVAVATLLLTAYGVVSVIAGGSYWLHYLVELVVPTALAGGLLVSLVPRPGRLLVAVVLVAAAIAWPIGLTKRVSASGQVVGAAVGRVTQPGDTMVSVFGDPDIPRSAGLESPYPYLWSLPARTLDRHFRRLGAVLAGPRAPTWFVARGPTTLTTLDRAGPGAVLRARYHQVGDVCGRMIYLRNGVARQAPVAPGGCTQLMSTWLDGGSP